MPQPKQNIESNGRSPTNSQINLTSNALITEPNKKTKKKQKFNILPKEAKEPTLAEFI
jgi:hypothetical protein